MPTAGFIYIGTFAPADTDEQNYSNENDAVFAGTHDSSVLRAVNATFTTADGTNTVEDADVDTPGSTFDYTLNGVNYNSVQDSTALYSADILLGDGTTIVRTVTVIQMTNGHTFITENDTSLDNLNIQSISLGPTSINDNYFGWAATRSVTGTQIVCFAQGTRIATPHGAAPVESLVPGDIVLTRDHGPQPVIWTGCRPSSHGGTALRFEKDTLGPGFPSNRLVVSRQHRMLLTSRIVARIAGTSEVLVPAWTLANYPGIAEIRLPRVIDWYHIMLPRHGILLAESAPTESFFPGPEALNALMPADQRIVRSFAARAGSYSLCRPEIRGKRARHLVERHMRNNVPLVEGLRDDVRVR